MSSQKQQTTKNRMTIEHTHACTRAHTHKHAHTHNGILTLTLTLKIKYKNSLNKIVKYHMNDIH
jgi:hypothetical protein